MLRLSSAGRRRLFLTSLYFSEGAPIGYLWWALPTKLRAAGADIEEVTALAAALALPWAFKFLWAPLIDGVRSRRFGRRGWIASAQIGMGLALTPLLFQPPGPELTTLLWVALLSHAVLAATQDVAVDGLEPVPRRCCWWPRPWEGLPAVFNWRPRGTG